MSIADELKQMAMEAAQGLQIRAARAQDELEKIKLRQLELEATIESARLASQRARDFKPGLGPDYQCPYCFVVNEARCTLRPVPSQTLREDVFRCGTCGHDITISF